MIRQSDAETTQTEAFVNPTDREHLGGAGSLLRVPHQHGLDKVVKSGRPADENMRRLRFITWNLNTV